MLTISCMPKPFRGHIGMIQRNAIASWTRLRPEPEVLVFGEEEGSAEVCQGFGVRHVPEIARNHFGTPLLADLFGKAQQLATHPWVSYANADIILTQSFLEAVQILQKRHNEFLMFCTPWNLDVPEPLDFQAPGWDESLCEAARRNGRQPRPVGADVFVFPRRYHRKIPPLAIGRTGSDNWLLYEASHSRLPAVDATPYVWAIHQNHAGTSHGRAFDLNEEQRQNHQIAGWWANSHIAADLPYELTPDGQLRKKLLRERLRPRALAIYYSPAIFGLVRRTQSLRRKIGLHRASRSRPVL